MKSNFVMVDFENVQPRNMGLLRGGPFKIKVFLGASQGKISLEMAQALQTFGEDAEYIQVVGNAKDALDFHIAYYIGRLSVEHPGASFSIISKDTGFDPLIKHLKSKDIECKRSASIADIPHIKSAALSPVASGRTATKATKAVASKTPAAPRARATPPSKPSRPSPLDTRLALVLDNLGRRQGLPATLKTLRSTIASLFKPALGDADLDALLAELARRGKIVVTGTKVGYALA